MALQDLTPQLRTRMSRVERAVGIFVMFATALLLAGFIYYVYHVATRKGWFLTKINYSTSLNNAAGLKVGDAVKLMGFTVGEITKVEANGPEEYYNVTVFFRIKKPYYGYLWTDSKVRVAAADFLGNRYLEVLKGKEGVPTVFHNDEIDESVLIRENVLTQLKTRTAQYLSTTNRAAAEAAAVQEVRKLALSTPMAFYVPHEKAKPFWIEPVESPAVTERLEQVVDLVQGALPGILNLTNALAGVMTNAARATDELNHLLSQARPIVTNLTLITENIRDPHGSLGEWFFPTNLKAGLDQTLAAATTTLTNTDTNLTRVVNGLDSTLINLANLTSNLNAQVQANSNLVSGVSSAIIHSDDLVQGLKRHWLLRSAFKPGKTNAPASSRTAPRSRK